MKGRIVHCSVDLDYIIHRGGAKLFVDKVRHDGLYHDEAWWIAHATILKASGRESLPTCDNFDRLGNCKGHEE